MSTIQSVLTATLLALIASATVAANEPPKTPVKPLVAPTRELLDKLLKSYRDYELPLPLNDAPLVVAVTGSKNDMNGVDTESRRLAFVVKAKKWGEPSKLHLSDGEVEEVGRRQVLNVIEPTPAALKGLSVPACVEFAVRCHSRGWSELALKVLESDPAGETDSPEATLARWAWDYWQRQFAKPETSRVQVARMFRLLWDRRLDDFEPYHRDLLLSLDESLVPGKGKPGTIEALIDGLIEVTATDNFRRPEKDPAYYKLARRGFEAVPALIAHLHDERLTRVYLPRINATHGYQFRVGDVAHELLIGLAGHKLRTQWPGPTTRLEKTQVEKWWVEAKNIGEGTYLARHVLDFQECSSSNWLMLDVLAHRHPKRIPEVYRKVLAGELTPLAVAVVEAVANCQLPRETKKELFLEATESTTTLRRFEGLLHLVKFDRVKAMELFGRELDRVPANAKVAPPNYRFDYGLPIVEFAIAANDSSVWTTFEKTLRQTDIVFRQSYLRELAEANMPEISRKTRLTILSRFLDDADVRDAVAESLADVLDLDCDRHPDGRVKDLPALRTEVRRVLKIEGIR